VLKALCTDAGFNGASRLLQVFGGHGYVREWGIEQHVRDARVTMIYEGTNEIQAIDLLARKVLADGGASLAQLLDALASQLDTARSGAAEVASRFTALRNLTADLASAARENATLPYEAADDYLRAVGLALFGWAWHCIEGGSDAAAMRWQAPAAAARLRILPEFDMRVAIIQTQCRAAAA
jgi:hypothetical protein